MLLIWAAVPVAAATACNASNAGDVVTDDGAGALVGEEGAGAWFCADALLVDSDVDIFSLRPKPTQ